MTNGKISITYDKWFKSYFYKELIQINKKIYILSYIRKKDNSQWLHMASTVSNIIEYYYKI